MGINILAIARLAAVIVGAIVPGVQAVETIAARFGSLHGGDKENAVVDLVVQALTAAEGVTGADVLKDPDVEAATRDVIQAVHGLHVVIAAKHPPAVAAPASTGGA